MAGWCSMVNEVEVNDDYSLSFPSNSPQEDEGEKRDMEGGWFFLVVGRSRLGGMEGVGWSEGLSSSRDRQRLARGPVERGSSCRNTAAAIVAYPVLQFLSQSLNRSKKMKLKDKVREGK